MKYIKLFEEYGDKILIIVDVQRSFHKFFTKNYLVELNKYAATFNKVYQIFDNHHDGKNVDKDFLYDENPDIENKYDLYKFNNQIGEPIEKRYTYDVDVDYFKKILSEEIYNKIKNKEQNNQLRPGDIFQTNEDTILTYTGNNHKWFHTPKKLYDLFQDIKGQNIVMVGGSSGECIYDVMVTAKALGLTIMKNDKYIYSAKSCPIK